MTPKEQARQGGEPNYGQHTGDLEEAHLRLSPIACAVADAWVPARNLSGQFGLKRHFPQLFDALDRLEAATRGSALRKVRP